MNEKIIEQLIEYMNVTKDFVLAESPELIREILAYEKYLSIFCLCVFIPLLLICLGIFIYTWINPVYEEYGSLAFKSILPLFICGGISVISFGIIIEAATGLIKINTAPKYFIIKKIVNLKEKK